jgi:hypothetical protein
VTRLAERLVEAHHVDAAEFMHLMTMGGSSAIPPRAPAALCAFFDLSHAFDGPLR